MHGMISEFASPWGLPHVHASSQSKTTYAKLPPPGVSCRGMRQKHGLSTSTTNRHFEAGFCRKAKDEPGWGCIPVPLALHTGATPLAFLRAVWLRPVLLRWHREGDAEQVELLGQGIHHARTGVPQPFTVVSVVAVVPADQHNQLAGVLQGTAGESGGGVGRGSHLSKSRIGPPDRGSEKSSGT